jgi:hypothetical protein
MMAKRKTSKGLCDCKPNVNNLPILKLTAAMLIKKISLKEIINA